MNAATEEEMIEAIQMLISNQVLFLQAMHLLESRIRILEHADECAGDVPRTIQ